MKRLIHSALFVSVLILLISCGNNPTSSLKSNEYLGDLPAILDTYYKSDSILRAEFEEKQKDIISEKDLPKLEKYMREFEEKELAIENRHNESMEKIKKELPGRKIPVANEDSNYEVSELIISNIDNGGVYLTGKLRTMVPVQKKGGIFGISFETRDNEGNAISPAGMIIVDDKDYNIKEIPSGTEYTFNLPISLSYSRLEKYTKFVEVAFIP